MAGSSGRRRVVVLVAFALLVLAGSVPRSRGASVVKKLTTVPGLNATLPFSNWVGYIDAGESDPVSGSYFFWFVEASDVDPRTAPVIVWMQGGPGCSGLLAFFTEHGPYRMDGPGTLTMNPYSWNKMANVLYLDAPVGAGYSYSRLGQYNVDDNTTAVSNYHALKEFFTNMFPNFAFNNIYAASESFGGHYMPLLAREIKRKAPVPFNFRGFFVGNPWTDDFYDGVSIPVWAFTHNLASIADYRDYVAACNITSPTGIPDRSVYDPFHPPAVAGTLSRGGLFRSLADVPAVDALLGNVGSATCGEAQSNLLSRQTAHTNQFDIYWTCDTGTDSEYVPCMDYTDLIDYLRAPATLAALGVNATNVPWPWTTCVPETATPPYMMTYGFAYYTVVPFYPALIEAGYQIIVYSGDVTWNCDTLGTQLWMESLDLPLFQDWTPWMTEHGQIGGFSVMYKGMSLVTIKGAGHMTATFKDLETLNFMQLALNETFTP